MCLSFLGFSEAPNYNKEEKEHTFYLNQENAKAIPPAPLYRRYSPAVSLADFTGAKGLQ